MYECQHQNKHYERQSEDTCDRCFSISAAVLGKITKYILKNVSQTHEKNPDSVFQKQIFLFFNQS